MNPLRFELSTTLNLTQQNTQFGNKTFHGTGTKAFKIAQANWIFKTKDELSPETNAGHHFFPRYL